MTSKKINCPWCGIANRPEAQSCVGCGSELTSVVSLDGDASNVSVVSAENVPVSPSVNTAKSKNRNGAKAHKVTLASQFRPGYVYATIGAVVILGYMYMKNDAPTPAVTQNTELTQSDSTGQRIASMEHYVGVNPNDKEALLAYANMLHDARMYARAIDAYRKYLDTDAKNADARVDMSICLFESGDAGTALVQLKKALDYSPKHQPAMYNLGIVYLNTEKVKESNDWFSRCVAVDPSTPLAARAKQVLSQHSSTNKNLQ